MNDAQRLRQRMEQDAYELQRLEAREQPTHNIGHFSKQHNEVPMRKETAEPEYESSSDEEEPAQKSAFESILPLAVAGGAGAVLAYRNRKGISKVKKNIIGGAKAVGRGVVGGAKAIGRAIGRRLKI